MTRRVAAFDFDGTIARRDTLVPFLFRQSPLTFVFAGAAGLVRAAVGDRALFRERLKAHLADKLFAGKAAGSIDQAGRSYADTLPPRYRPEVLEQIAWHRGQGHPLVLVTASLGVYARPAAAELGFDEVIATELETSPDGVLTGALAGANVRGPEKALRLQAWLGDGDVELWAYGDSSGDTEMLAMADHPTWVGRRAARSGQRVSPDGNGRRAAGVLPVTSPKARSITMRAVINGTLVAESDETVVVEGNHYFPPSSVKNELLSPAQLTTVCSWKGTASYYDLTVDGETLTNVAWYYPDPKDGAAEIRDYVAFYPQVSVTG